MVDAVPVACAGWSNNGGCWYTAPNLGMNCTQVCAGHGGFNVGTSQHVGNAVEIGRAHV